MGVDLRARSPETNFFPRRAQSIAIAGWVLGGLGFIAAFGLAVHPARAEVPTPAATPKATTYPELLKILEGPNPPKNLDEFLPRLPADLLSNFTFVYGSKSPHGDPEDPAQSAVDPLHPRTVLFSQDARLLVAFTGNPRKPGYNVVETIHFDDQTSAFSAHRFVLKDAISNPALARLAKQNGERNPPACTRCHGSDPRPIFDSYNVWPGFYGSLADQPELAPKELKNYRQFLKQQRSRPDLPYRYLKFPEGSPVPPYSTSPGGKPAQLVSLDQLRLLPNTRLGMALTELNRKRLFRKMKASPKYKGVRMALLSGLLGCEKFPDPRCLPGTDFGAFPKGKRLQTRAHRGDAEDTALCTFRDAGADDRASGESGAADLSPSGARDRAIRLVVGA